MNYVDSPGRGLSFGQSRDGKRRLLSLLRPIQLLVVVPEAVASPWITIEHPGKTMFESYMHKVKALRSSR